MISSDINDQIDGENRYIQDAISIVNAKAVGSEVSFNSSVTINFHPQISKHNDSVIACLMRDDIYRSQFETGTSNGSLSPLIGGRRWLWEKKMFDGIFDDAPAALRPKYGTLDHLGSGIGGAPRFGSAHLRLKKHVIPRCTFAYPESHIEPTAYGTAEQMALLPLVIENKQKLEPLDNYIEAHVHGLLRVSDDVEAVVLDPSYRDTQVEIDAQSLPCELEWHQGFVLAVERFDDCVRYRGKAVADFIKLVAKQGILTPALLDNYRDDNEDQQLVKKAWHCIARFGAPLAK